MKLGVHEDCKLKNSINAINKSDLYKYLERTGYKTSRFEVSLSMNPTFTPEMFIWPDAILNPSFESDKHDTSLVCPSKKLSFPDLIFLITTNDPKGYNKYFPQGVYVNESRTAPVI